MAKLFSEICATKENQIHQIHQDIADSKEIIALKEAISYYKDDYNLHFALAKAYNYHLRYREAIECLNKAVEIDRISPKAYRNRASRYINTLQFDKAYEDFAYCDSLKPHDLDNIYRMCIIRYYQNRYEEAVPLFLEALELTKDDGEMGIGMIYWYILNIVKLGDKEELKRVCNLYTKDMYVGHHTAYQRVVELFCGMRNAEDIETEMLEEQDDLEHSTTMYGVYIYYKYIKDEEKAKQALEKTIKRDYVWPCLAYIGAYNDCFPHLANNTGENFEINIPQKLQDFLKENNKIAIAFSGGVDSSYLVYAAKIMGCSVTAYYVKTDFQPQFELLDAKAIAKLTGVNMVIINADALTEEKVKNNPYDRCYYCKKNIFSHIIENAKQDGYTTILDGTNASDDYDDRPGMKALEQLKVLSPLRICGITKDDVRTLSKNANLFTWNKPSYACLATRIPTGMIITPELLHKVERAETELATLGFSGFRVRVLNLGCKLEIRDKDMDKVFEKRTQISNILKKEFDFVALDLSPRREE